MEVALGVSIQLYSKKRALVQSGLKTQTVGLPWTSPLQTDGWLMAADPRNHHRRDHRDLSHLPHHQCAHEQRRLGQRLGYFFLSFFLFPFFLFSFGFIYLVWGHPVQIVMGS